MTIKIPEKFMGKPIKGSMEIVLAQAPQASAPTLTQTQTVNLGVANINPREYIQVGIDGLNGKPVAISAYELQGSNNKNYEDTHRFVLEKGLYMPTPRIFMTHFKNVISAKECNTSLSYADGTKVPDSEAEEMYKHLTKNHKDVFGVGNPGAWTWLNAGFDKGNIETTTGIDSSGNLTKTSSRLESCLNEDCLADLEVNSQGLSIKHSVGKNYRPGENVFFYYPRNKCVARFFANSEWANLNCGRDPTYSYPALGVFACAEGAPSQKN